MLKKQKAQMESRILTGKQSKLDPDERARLREQALKERFEYESTRHGQWELIYPWPEEARNETYGEFIRKAQDIWDEFTTGKGKRVSMEDKRKDTANLNKNQSKKTLAGGGSKMNTGILSNNSSMNNLRTANGIKQNA